MAVTSTPVVLASGLWLVGGPGLTADSDALAYLLDCGGGQAVLIDCGTDAGKLLDHVSAAGFAPAAVAAILATHGHVDHVGAAAELVAAGCGGVWLHEAEAAAARDADPIATGAYLYGQRPRAVPVVRELAGDGAVRFGTRTVLVVATPGHSPGSVSYVVDCAGTRIALLGDALWAGSTRGSAPTSRPGRTPSLACGPWIATRCRSGTGRLAWWRPTRRRSPTHSGVSGSC
jgi:glyoxylase-like metal-dependent hydrolase (beta-lactamase superfamily II)